MAKHSVRDDGDLRKYYAAIPNIVFRLGLNPYELALYAHFKQAAGDDGGACWKSRATIAKESGMSSGMVTKARQALEAPRLELDNRPLIVVSEEPSKSGGKPTCRVVITDIWTVNMSKCSTSPHDVASVAPSSHDEQRHHTSLATSPHVPKEEPKKKNQEEPSAHAGLMKFHADHLRGEMPDGAAQGAAAKWLLERYSMEAITECYERLLGETWRSGGVTLLTVKKMISQQPKVPVAPPARTYEWQGRYYALGEVVSDDGERYTVMGADGTPSKRWHTDEAFAADMGITVEQAKHGMGAT